MTALQHRPFVDLMPTSEGLREVDIVDLIDATEKEESLGILRVYLVEGDDPAHEYLSNSIHSSWVGSGRTRRLGRFFTADAIRAAERLHQEFLEELRDG